MSRYQEILADGPNGQSLCALIIGDFDRAMLLENAQDLPDRYRI